jgi:hypothetical protein
VIDRKSRNALTKKVIVVNLVLSLVIGLLGCTSTAPKEPPVLPDELRARLTTVGVAALGTSPDATIAIIPKGPVEGAGAGAKSGAEVGAAPGMLVMHGATGSTPILIPLGAIIAVAGAVVGAATGVVYGAVAAEPEEKVREAEEIIGEAILKLEVQKTLRDQILETAGLKTKYRFVALPDYNHTESNGETDYLKLNDEEIGVLLETSVLSFGLVKLANTPSPKVGIFIETTIRLVETDSGNILYDDPFTYRSDFYDYFYWSEDEGKRLLEGLDKGYQSLAEKIVQEIFLRI